jgi:hypothetical protein
VVAITFFGRASNVAEFAEGHIALEVVFTRFMVHAS